MEPLRTVAEFWSWLPAFRAVAETCHLPSAAATFDVTPSALSRAIKQLEQRLGCELFRRANRRLLLTHEGEHLLVVMRDAMRRVHEASLRLQGGQRSGPLRVASAAVATWAWVLPAVLELRARFPELEPELVTDLDDLAPRLLGGRLDVAFLARGVRHRQLRTERLGSVAAGIFCGPAHPLHGAAAVTRAQVQAQDFVAPPETAEGAPQDGWPAELDRRVALRVDRMQVGAQLLLEQPLLAVLPDRVAARIGRGALYRLPLEVVPPVEVCAVLRPPIGRQTVAEQLLEAVRDQVEAGAVQP